MDAWKAREKKLNRSTFAGGRSDTNLVTQIHQARILWARSKAKVVPGNQIAKPENDLIWRYRFLADAGDRFLFEEFGHEWNPEKGDFVPMHSEELFDGKSSKSFYDKGLFDHPFLSSI